jgi:murein DD-endopeptidase MepM/ murein hydrolase activator NlpD
LNAAFAARWTPEQVRGDGWKHCAASLFHCGKALLAVAALAFTPLAAAAPAPFKLAWPLACTLGQTCAIQHYVDDDPGPEAHDYACKGRTYPKHDGTDIRLTSMALERRGVNVLAAAPGTVLRVRDGVRDISMRDLPPGALANRECGNGLVIDHGGGWETQYCHLRQGSLVVRSGDTVVAGSVLGKVGLSGDTEFPHLHLTVRKNGKAVDPFAFGAPVGACRAGRSLWANTPPYREGQVLVAGFAAGPVEMNDVQDRGTDQPRPDRNSPLVAFVQAIGLEAGDVQRLVLQGPDGAVLADGKQPPLDHDKDQQLQFVGRGHAPPAGWPAGQYRASYSVTRAGKIVITAVTRIML